MAMQLLRKRKEKGLSYRTFASEPIEYDGVQDPHPHNTCLEPTFIIGYNGEEASNNLIWNEKEGWILFTT